MNKDTEKRSSHPVMKRPFFHIKTPPKRTWKGQKDTLRYIKLSVFIFPNGGFMAHLSPPALVIFQKCFHAQTLNAILPEKVPGRIDVVYTIDMFVFIKQVMKLRTHHCVYFPGKYFGLLSVELHLIDFSQIVCKRLIEEESETHSREKLLTSILFVDNFNEYEVTKRATHYGITISGKQSIAIIKTVGLNDPASIKRIQSLVENEFRYYDINKLLIYSQFETIVVMFPLEVFGKDSVVHFFEKIADKIHKEFEIEAYIGIGLGYEYLADIRESYTEAKSALQLISMEKQKYVLSYNDMGIHSLISQIRSPKTLDNYINDKLGRLIETDKVQDSELCNTLRAYIENNCNSNATAELLFIHRNTMRYRLDKIEKILNVDLDDLSVCLELKLAFIILDFRNSRKN